MAGEKTKQAILEETSDVIEETLDTLEHVRPGRLNLNGTTKGQQIFFLSAAALLGAGVGYLVTRKLLTKKLEAKFEALAAKDIQEAKEYYQQLSAVRERPKSPEEVLAELHGTGTTASEAAENAKEAAKLISSYGGSVADAASVELPVAPIEEKHNIFTDAESADTDVFDYSTELKKREEQPDRPYIISEQEFDEGEPEYDTVQMTYYDGDDTLADEKDMTVPDPDLVVGSDNLTRFGYGSNDSKTLYVRNDNLEVDFEITLHGGKYQVVVLGFEDPDKELQHSHRPRSRRNWDDDDE